MKPYTFAKTVSPLKIVARNILNLSSLILLVNTATYRHQISALLAKILGLPNTQCISGICYDNSTNTEHRRK
ncbi:hypothetical protein CPS_0530 [Colwellia psychrerythraea 34H]|uniref:Uncharacterized protein n=1 Tax=Colwellia psychrerythraea (strain 34H / ATCC BAA-681) TaxID=167879 RepID=Q489H6_COLP3|nr:hypothetical protein CPS_0530 [Colwellia psychrerythraea 34H]